MKLLSFLKLIITSLFADLLGREKFTCVNDAGTHTGGCVTRFAQGAIAARHLHVTPGADAGKQVITGSALLKPCGTAFDQAADGEEVAVLRFGSANTTRKAVSSKDIAAEVELFTDDAGKVTDVAVDGCWLIGISLTAVDAADELIEFDPIQPVEQTV